MHPLGHIAVSCGTVWAGAQALERATGDARVLRVIQAIDFRLVALGALLPDLIDKPIGWIIFRDHFDANGHLYGHTVLAALLIVVPGVVLLSRRLDPRLLAMGLGMLMHFVVDPVNHAPKNLLWPLLGTGFDHVLFLNGWQTVVTESAAGVFLAATGVYLYRTGRLRALIVRGRLPALREVAVASDEPAPARASAPNRLSR